jgi:mitogen-activated protein kinase kinase kinase
LFIANPDNSDEEGISPKSGDGKGPRSPVRTSPMTASSSSSSGRVPISSGSPLNGKPNIPTVPAPQSSPLPSATIVPPRAVGVPIPPLPPQPPPHPDRHYRRAQTTPTPEALRPTPETRTSGPSTSLRDHPPSPSRALPPLPSPPLKTPSPSNLSPVSLNTYTLPPVPFHPPFFPPSGTPHLRQQSRLGSPEDMLSPSITEGGSGSGDTLGPGDSGGGRGRSGSVTSGKIRLQVTTDNESFTTVDVTGMQSAAGIKERVFSKVRLH